jgi:molybdopterin-guanine dinucleotide biosynthesis protein A
MPEHYPREQITALILAGGKGRRMGGADKGLVAYAGRPLVQHVAASLASQADKVLLSANRSHAAYRELGFTPLADNRPDFAGPLAGIETALASCSTPYLLVCPCDTPHIPRDYGPRLWHDLQKENAELAYAWDGEREHYLHLLLPLASTTDLTAYLDSGQRAVRHWLMGKVAAKARFTPEEMANINTQQA